MRIPGVGAASPVQETKSWLKAGIPSEILLFQVKYVEMMDLNMNLKAPQFPGAAQNQGAFKLQMKAKDITGDVLSYYFFPPWTALVDLFNLSAL